jgi:hypothetical protein
MLVVQRRLGHSSIYVTERVYGHLMPSALDDAAERIDTAYRPSCQGPTRSPQWRTTEVPTDGHQIPRTWPVDLPRNAHSRGITPLPDRAWESRTLSPCVTQM